MHMKKPIFTLGILMAGVLSSCEGDLGEEMHTGQVDKVPLSIHIAAGEVQDYVATKDIVSGNALPIGSVIGLRVVDGGNSTYDGATYENVPYTFNGTLWESGSDVLLSATPGTVYAYHPWKSGVNLSSVPLQTGGDDFMYSTSASVDIKNPSATLSMKHVMAEVLVTLENNGYSGTGTVTGMTWVSASASGSGTLNAISGAVTASTPGSLFDSGLSGSNTQSINTSTKYSFLVVPTKTNAAPTFSIMMDGASYSATGGEVEYKSGMRYSYKLVMRNKSLTVGSVSVEEWGTSDQGTLNPS